MEDYPPTPTQDEASAASTTPTPTQDKASTASTAQKVPPSSGDASPTKVSPPGGDDSSASTTHFRRMVQKVEKVEVKDDKKTGVETSQRRHDPFTSNTVLFLFFMHSIAMFFLPFVTYFLAKDIAETRYDVSTSKSYVYGAAASIISVQLIIISYVCIAFVEQGRDLPRKQKTG